MGFFARRWVVTGAVTVAVAGVGATVGQIGVASASIKIPAGTTRSGPVPGSVYVPTSRTLYFGSHGPAVRALQQRLRFLHYYAGRADGTFGWDTLEGVWAFKEVQSGKIEPRNASIVGPAMQRQLGNTPQGFSHFALIISALQLHMGAAVRSDNRCQCDNEARSGLLLGATPPMASRPR